MNFLIDEGNAATSPRVQEERRDDNASGSSSSSSSSSDSGSSSSGKKLKLKLLVPDSPALPFKRRKKEHLILT